jgi:hypothetical protein
VLAVFVAISVPTFGLAQSPYAIEGDWLLSLTEGKREHTGVLTLESTDTGVIAFVDGGPVSLELRNDEIDLDIDYRDGGGRLLNRHLNGRIRGDVMSGTVTYPLDAPPGSWHAVRIVEQDTSRLKPRPVDLTGVWSRTSPGISKVHLDYTDHGQQIVDSYNYLDDPALRCVSPGLVRVSGWPYPLEILQREDRVTILYESFHEVRQIFLDGREISKDLPNRAMGYSSGHWEGSTLVVETDTLKAGYVDLAGQPLSENARVVERMSISDDGQKLRSELTLYDPENYKRPVIRHRTWNRTPETMILEYDCDPYPFFRGLALEDKLDEYWIRMRQSVR